MIKNMMGEGGGLNFIGRGEKMEMSLESWRRLTGVLGCGSMSKRMNGTPR